MVKGPAEVWFAIGQPRYRASRLPLGRDYDGRLSAASALSFQGWGHSEGHSSGRHNHKRTQQTICRHFKLLLKIPRYWAASGADEPANSLLPSAVFMLFALQLFDPSFARKPSTEITSPAFKEFLVQP